MDVPRVPRVTGSALRARTGTGTGTGTGRCRSWTEFAGCCENFADAFGGDRGLRIFALPNKHGPFV